jgi:hypothetical protein
MSNPTAGGGFQPSSDITFTGRVAFTGATSIANPTITGAGGGANGTAASSVTASESQFGAFHQTVLTLAGLPMAISDTHVGGGSKIYTFPEGNITIIGATAHVQETTTSVLASTLKASKTLSVGVGSVQTTTQDSGTLVTTQQDIVNAFACTSSATINVAGTAVNGKQLGTTIIRLDGTTTASPVWLNCGVVTNTDIDADATTTWSGTVTITWVYSGDY